MNQQAQILIVDDVAQNIQIIASMLKSKPYSLSFAQSGPVALALLNKRGFDLILLDLQMPIMDGFEVCQRVSDTLYNADTPVIFLTANAGTDLTVKGFQMGAVDYISKPVEALELQARVRTHLELKRARDQILKQNERLQELNQGKNELLSMVSHDLRNPLTVMMSGIDYLLRHVPVSADRLQRRLKNMFLAVERMQSIIEHFLSREAIRMGYRPVHYQQVQIQQLFTSVVSHFAQQIEEKKLTIHLSTENFSLHTDPAVITQILDNLLSNAIKYSPPESNIQLSASLFDQQWFLSIQDEGPGFTLDEQQHLFEQAGRRSAIPTSGEASHGLGLIIVKKLVDLLKGEISCHSAPGQGACFEIDFERLLPEIDPVP